MTLNSALPHHLKTARNVLNKVKEQSKKRNEIPKKENLTNKGVELTQK